MAFYRKKKTIEQLQAALDEREDELQEIRPFVEMAQSVKKKLEELLELYKTADLTKMDIAQMAFDAVLEVEKERARKQLADRYRVEHRELLAAKVLELTEVEEGETIAEKAKRVLETDPVTALELRESARRALMARFQAENASALEAEQASYVQAELARKLDQDRLDVQFALAREIDMTSAEDSGSMFMPDDTLKIELSNTAKWGNKRRGLNFSWQKDAKGREGWTFDKEFGVTTDAGFQPGNKDAIPTNVFVTIGSMCPDLEEGTDVFMPDKLIAGCPLAVEYKKPGASKKTRAVIDGTEMRRNYDGKHYVYDSFPVDVAAVDFEIRPVVAVK